jgi:hypothetical protein
LGEVIARINRATAVAKFAIVGRMSESSREHGRTKQHHVYLRRLLVAASVDIRANCICSTVTMCAAL